MASILSTAGLARASARRPWTVIGVWLIALVASGFAPGVGLRDVVTTGAEFLARPESERAYELLRERYYRPRAEAG
jgi:hypothetical protein